MNETQNKTMIGLTDKEAEFYKNYCMKGIDLSPFNKILEKWPVDKDFRGSITLHFNPGKITIEKREFTD